MAFPAKLGMLLVLALTCQCPSRAQLVASVRAGLVHYSQGTVYLDAERLRAGGALRQMQPGQTLSTGQGRVEVLLAPSIVMRLGENASIRIEDTRLEDIHLAISKGPVIIEVVALEKYARLRVFFGNRETDFRRSGLYRFDSSPTRLRVYGGEAGVLRAEAPVTAKRGQAVELDALELSEFDPKAADALHSWAAERSFTLFNASPENRRTQNHWKYLGDGWLWNRNYGVKYRSAQARAENRWVDQQLRRPDPHVHRADTKE